MLNICHYYMVLFAIWHPGNCLHLGLGYPCCLNATSADFSCEKENSTTALQCYAPFLLIQVLKVVSRSRKPFASNQELKAWRCGLRCLKPGIGRQPAWIVSKHYDKIAKTILERYLTIRPRFHQGVSTPDSLSVNIDLTSVQLCPTWVSNCVLVVCLNLVV